MMFTTFKEYISVSDQQVAKLSDLKAHQISLGKACDDKKKKFHRCKKDTEKAESDFLHSK